MTLSGFPSITIRYGKSGGSEDVAHASKLRSFVNDEALDDLIVISHGWNNSENEAMYLYTDMMSRLQEQIPKVTALDGRKIGVMAVIWPSKKFKAFEQPQDVQNGGAASTARPASSNPADDIVALFDALDDDISEGAKTALRNAAADAIDDKSAFPAFMAALRAVIPGTMPDELADNALFDSAGDATAADQFETSSDEEADAWEAGGGGAAGGVVSGAAGAVGSVLNYATFYMMKRRAGHVGERGVGRTIAGLRAARPDLRIHFVGHSFGARVVTYAAYVLNGEAEAAPDSMTLLQAAFSHNGFSGTFPAPHGGYFRRVITKPCVNGPILVSHTHNDWPVRVAYSIASALVGQNAAFTNNAPSQFGGLGANGAQKTAEAIEGSLKPSGGHYTFTRGRIYNLNADAFIHGHSDIRGGEVAYAIATAIS